MTVIAIRDGVMALDSRVGGGDLHHGSMTKWRKVPEIWGGGYVAGAGDAAVVRRIMEHFVETGQMGGPSDGYTICHLSADGKVRHFESDGWYDFEADYFVAGSGEAVAMGALAQGATAEEAVNIACKHVESCAGPVVVLRANE